MELMLDLAGVICGGVMDRHPNLRVGFLEGNCSWLPWWLWRLDEERGDFRAVGGGEPGVDTHGVLQAAGVRLD